MFKSPYKTKPLTVDDRGRITIPEDVRKATGINPNSDVLAIYTEGKNYVIITVLSQQYFTVIANKTIKEIKNNISGS
jgi:AbrB family looped-hinge helix DNA binding protein